MRARTRSACPPLGPAIALFLQACAGPSFDGRVYSTDELAFRVGPVPPDWHAVDSGDGVLAFRDERTPASIAITGRCGKDGDDVPLESLTHHLFLQFTDRSVQSQERLPMDGREAMHTRLIARLDGVEKQFSVFVLKKNGCVYDFVYVAPPASDAEGEQRFSTFVEGFSTLRP